MVPCMDGWFTMKEKPANEEVWHANFHVPMMGLPARVHVFKLPSKLDIDWLLLCILLDSTAEYHTIANCFGISTPFVCSCLNKVCEAIVPVLKSSFIFFTKR